MPVNIQHRKVGDVACLYPEGKFSGLSSGPVKTLVKELLEQNMLLFIINFKNVRDIDAPGATSLNSIHKEIQRADGKLILTNAGKDIIPWLEKYATECRILNTEEMALERLSGYKESEVKGNIAVTGASDFASALFKGAKNYKGLVFNFFDDPDYSADKIISINPKVIVVNLESGPSTIAAIRKWRFAKATKKCPIILFGPPSLRKNVPALIKEGANDFIELTFSGAEVLAYLKPLDFRNILAKKLDMVISGEYEQFVDKPHL